MSSRNLRRAAFLIVRRKAAASRVLPALGAAFAALLGYLWIRDSYALALRTFIFLFPYFFLFLSQDMFREEIDSGALENVIFVNGGFRDYLLAKTLILALIGLTASSAVFGMIAACGLALSPGRLAAGHIAQFLVGALAGLYYLFVGGYLGFFLKAGSNVLVVIIGQVFLAIGFFLSLTARRGWAEVFLTDTFPGLSRKLRFIGLTLLFPNAVIIRKHPVFIAGLALATLAVAGLGWRRVRRLELFRR